MSFAATEICGELHREQGGRGGCGRVGRAPPVCSVYLCVCPCSTVHLYNTVGLYELVLFSRVYTHMLRIVALQSLAFNSMNLLRKKLFKNNKNNQNINVDNYDFPKKT